MKNSVLSLVHFQKEMLKFLVEEKEELVATAEIPLSLEGSDGTELKMEYVDKCDPESMNDSFVTVQTPSMKRPSATEVS